jgi:hypothetical protein
MAQHQASAPRERKQYRQGPKPKTLRLLALVAALILVSALPLVAQNANTGAVAGTVTDPSGAVVPNAKVTVTNQETQKTITVTSQNSGGYLVPYLQPGVYRIEVLSKGFRALVLDNVVVHVTDTQKVDLKLQLGSSAETISVYATLSPLATETIATGSVTEQKAVQNLPLVSRNYTQIVTLSPNVSSEVNDAAGLGKGTSSGANGSGGVAVQGGTTNGNNYQMNGLQVNDLFGAPQTGGVPVPNPDTIQEFKVQVSQYDAAYGRSAGADVDVVTKTGGNAFHGTVFEFFRNDVLNANEYFRKLNQQPRAELKQNQFGFTLGGPIKRDKLLFFTSYQGTRQVNGVDSRAACLTSFSSPPLTDDRSTGALGGLFNGPSDGTIAIDGSNINPVSLALLQAKLPNGTFLIPTPQQIDTSAPFGIQGSSSITDPCTYNEDQFMVNADYNWSPKSTLVGRFFFANASQAATLTPSMFTGASSVPGFPVTNDNEYRVASLTHTYAFRSNLLLQSVLGYHRVQGNSLQREPNVILNGQSTPVPLTFAALGASVPATDTLFGMALQGFSLGGFGFSLPVTQNHYDLQESVSYVRGRHSLQFGGGLSRAQVSLKGLQVGSDPIFLGDPNYTNFLLGQPLVSVDFQGDPDRSWRVWNDNLFVQDTFRVTRRFTLLFGLRYELQGLLGETEGRASTIDIRKLNPNPPSEGTLEGYVVGSNFKGTPPSGVTRGPNTAALDGTGKNTFGPRLGFTWLLPGTDRLVLRAGYGMYYSRTAAEYYLQTVFGPPYGQIRQVFGTSLSSPFPPSPPPPPFFPPYSPGTDLTPISLATNFRPPIVQSYSANLQTLLGQDFVLQVGYSGARDTHLVQEVSFNQALSASPSSPVRGETTNTLANIAQRVPYLGFDPANADLVETQGNQWYNALEVSLNKHFSHGLQFLGSYTWARALATTQSLSENLNGGLAIGDQNDPRARYGPNSFVRPHRFVFSYIYELPKQAGKSSLLDKLINGWAVAGVTTIQAGQRLTLTETNTLNAFGIVTVLGNDGDRAQLGPGCVQSQVVRSGSVTSKLNNYFNASCFTAPPIIGADGLATGFGDSGVGIASGPAQNNSDIALIKRTNLFGENRVLEFRAEFFNAFNTPQFSNPTTSVGSVVPGESGQPAAVLDPNPLLGHIQSTAVNPRIIQFALKFSF